MFLKHAKNPMFLGMGNHLEPFSKVSEPPIFLAMGNHLEPFPEVSDPPEGQEQGGGAVGGQGQLQGVKL